MIRNVFGRHTPWMLAPAMLALFIVAACGSSDEPGVTPSAPTDSAAIQTEVASTLATQEAFQQQIDESVAATVAAQSPDATPEPEASPTGKADEEVEPTPTATAELEPTVAPSPTATSQPDPTSTPAPPAPTATPEPPKPTPAPTEVPPTATPEAPDTITFERPDSGHAVKSGEHLSFAQATASFDIAQYPARAFIHSGVYFGLGEDVTSIGAIENSFVAETTGKVRVTVDAGWNGTLSTNGLGSMNSNFEIRLAVLGPDRQAIKAPVVGGQAAIDSSVAGKPVSGNQALTIEVLVEDGVQYTIQLLAVCHSTGSSNIWASDTECAFDSVAGGYVEWRSLTAEYLP